MGLIFNYKDTNVLKKSDLSYKQGEDFGVSHLYRMVLKPDNTVRVEIAEEKIYEGSIKEDWEVLKPKEIPDPDDKKPEDWVDSSMMDDESASKPDDWDDEEDGEWEAPMKDNPAYKGDWSVKRIENPAYKGIWEAKKIANPEYVDDDKIYSYADFGFLGFDLWQVKGGTIFDNIILCDDVAEADEFAKKWKALNEVETAKKKEEDDAKKAESADAENDDDYDADDDKAESEDM